MLRRRLEEALPNDSGLRLDAMMRLRPDRIACGELRSRNTWTLLSLLNNGHGGCMTTIQAKNEKGEAKKI